MQDKAQDKQKEIAFFDRHAAADDYDVFTPQSSARLVDAFVKLTGLPPGARVIDLGCGSGTFTALLARHGFDCVGLDISAKLVAVGRRKHPQIEFVAGDIERLPFPAASFDGALLSGVVHHFPDRDELGGNVEPDAVEAGAREQRGERARAAAEIDHACAGRQLCQLYERIDQARARLRREHVVVVRGGVAVEERDLFLLVLLLILHSGRHLRIGSDLSCPGHSASEDARKRAYDPGIHRKKLLMKRMVSSPAMTVDGSYITAGAVAASHAPAAGRADRACWPRSRARARARSARRISQRPAPA